MIPLAVTLMAVLAGPPTTAPAGPLARFEKVVHPMVKAINAGDYEALGRDFDETMTKLFPPAKSKPFFEGLKGRLGKIEKLDPGKLAPPGSAVFAARFERGVLDMKIFLDARGKVAGLLFLPHTADLPVADRKKTPMTLPVRGRWAVHWGGDTKELNYHRDVPSQRFAMDLLIRSEKGLSHKGDGLKNDDYYAFGKEILCPGDGVVTDVIRGIRDNAPGSMNPYSAMGNAVFIRHAKHEISVLAHFKLGSIKVKVGQKVAAGEVLGLCGNSGNSSEAHLHYHLMNTPIAQDATGIKCYFRNVTVETKGKTALKKQHSPVKGEVVTCKGNGPQPPSP